MMSWNLPENIPALTRQGIYMQFTNGEVSINTRDRGFFESTHDAGYKAINPMFTRDTDRGKAGYGHESIGEVMREFWQLKRTQRRVLPELEQIRPSSVDGFYASLTAQAVDQSLAQGQQLQGGQIVIGKEVDCNDLLQAELGGDADQYLIDIVK